MKKRLLLFVFFIFSVSLLAQLDRSKIPQPGIAPAVAFPDYEMVKTKNGIRVFLVKNSELPTINIRLLIDTEPVLEKEYAGLLNITGSMLRNGTITRTKDQLDEAIDYIGASIYSGSTFVYANGLSKYTEKIFELMSDIIINPTFPQNELDKQKEQTISGLKYRKTDPNALSNVLQTKVLYGNNHPYGDVETEETIGKITKEKCTEFYNTYFKPNYAIMAVVGDFDKKKVLEYLDKYFGSWQKGSLPSPKYNNPKNPDKVTVDLIDRSSSVQTVINVCQLVELTPNSPDIIKAQLMNTVLGGGVFRLFMNLREKHSYTYGAYSSLQDNKLIGQFSATSSVGNSVTDSSLNEIFYEIRRIQNEKVALKELNMAKNYTSGSFVLSLESPNTIASYAINIEKDKLPKDYYKTYLKKIEAVTSDDVQKMAKKYLTPENMRIVLVGNAKEIADKISKFGKINYYDEDGNPIVEKSEKINITAAEIISKYIENTGGQVKYETLKDMTVELSGKMPGFELLVKFIQKSPDKFLNEVNVKNMFENLTGFDGKKGWSKQNKEVKELADEDIAAVKNKTIFNFYLNYARESIKAELTGIKTIKGNDYFEIKFSKDGKPLNTEYFGKNDFLKFREITTQKTPQGDFETTIDYVDYKDVNGILFPMRWIQGVMGQSIDMTVNKVEFNTNVDDKLFDKP